MELVFHIAEGDAASGVPAGTTFPCILILPFPVKGLPDDCAGCAGAGGDFAQRSAKLGGGKDRGLAGGVFGVRHGRFHDGVELDKRTHQARVLILWRLTGAKPCKFRL